MSHSLMRLFFLLALLSSFHVHATVPCDPKVLKNILRKPEGLAKVAAPQVEVPIPSHWQLSENADGPNIIIPNNNPHTRPIESIKKLRIANYNVLNLIESVEKLVGWTAPREAKQFLPSVMKPEWQLKGVAETIVRSDADIIFIQEAQTYGALRVLTDQYLGGKYEAILIEGNDPRGIDVGVLIKKDLPFDFEVQSFRNRKTKYEQQRGQPTEVDLFSRDLPTLIVRPKGEANANPLFVASGTHYKSQRDKETPWDPGSGGRREGQVKGTVEIMRELESRFGKNTMMMLVGDYNNDVRAPVKEFKPLWDAGWADSFNLSPRQIPNEQRSTHAYFGPEGPSYDQLDSISVNPAGRNLVLDAVVLPYLDEAGTPKPLPKSFGERKQNPSDHYMIYADFNFEPLLSRSQVR